MDVREITIRDSGAAVTLPNDCRISIGFRSSKLIQEIVVSAFETSKSFLVYADLKNAGEGRFEPILQFVTEVGPSHFLIVAGLFEVVCVDCERQSIETISVLNRKEEEDRGFYWLKYLLKGNYLLIIYEGGVIRIDDSGTIVWQTNLFWDDIFLRSDEDYLYYSSEFDDAGEYAPLEWLISVKTGEKILFR